ncbi:vWA domain-containing protein [Anaerotignum sp. MB30-C6]|uniref:vWA domain-containing protein n=1 Tax=Anaerotignum sp. MB30-C6 TaxID=3070814 RepID=UPI0027DCDA53|nr:VWA-like domain-containing protein [Anaerotignum sp. MB30-C6]WMI81089.1 VWA-like domain-containing protein [Anaerotignum sp. MB30-C6]
MNENHQRLIQIGNAILNASRNELYLSLRFMDIALSGLRYEMNLSSLYVGTDGEKVLFNPRYLVERYQSDPVLVNRLYLHMLLHCIFRHPFHMGNRDEALWGLACDIAVESIIDALPVKATQLVVSDRRNELYDQLKKDLKVLSAEGIYRKLSERNFTDKEFGKLQLEFWVDDHVFWEQKKEDNQNENNENQDNENNQENEDESEHNQQKQRELEEKWQQIGEKMETNLETFAKDLGESAGDLLQLLKIENREKYDYRHFLKKFVTLKEDMRVDDDAYDYIFYTYGLSLYGNMPLIESLEYKEVKKIEELVIAIDTSESCEGQTVRRFLEETYAILKSSESFFHKVNIHIIQSDAKVQQDITITSQEDLEKYMDSFRLMGSGGTDFRPVFEYVDKLIAEKAFQNLKGLIYFTDGYGTFPRRRPSYDTAFVFFHEEYLDLNVPPWAMKVVLGPEDLSIYDKEK